MLRFINGKKVWAGDPRCAVINGKLVEIDGLQLTALNGKLVVLHGVRGDTISRDSTKQ